MAARKIKRGFKTFDGLDSGDLITKNGRDVYVVVRVDAVPKIVLRGVYGATGTLELPLNSGELTNFSRLTPEEE